MQPLRADDREAGIGIAEHQHGVGLQFRHQVVGTGDDIPHRLPETVSHGVQVDFRRVKLQILEKHAVEVIVIVLPRMGKEGIKISAALVDHRRKADDLGSCADDDQQLQLAVFLPCCVLTHASTASK